jgi:hypothetical protein
LLNVQKIGNAVLMSGIKEGPTEYVKAQGRDIHSNQQGICDEGYQKK